MHKLNQRALIHVVSPEKVNSNDTSKLRNTTQLLFEKSLGGTSEMRKEQRKNTTDEDDLKVLKRFTFDHHHLSVFLSHSCARPKK